MKGFKDALKTFDESLFPRQRGPAQSVDPWTSKTRAPRLEARHPLAPW